MHICSSHFALNLFVIPILQISMSVNGQLSVISAEVSASTSQEVIIANARLVLNS